MLTGAGRAMAEDRHAYTTGFLERLEREWAAGWYPGTQVRWH
jgi:hypothetical protein